MQRFPWVCALMLASTLSLVGCEGGPRPVLVKGMVFLDGQPMPDGDIAFQSNDGRPPVHATIENGQFSLHTLPGSYRVLINRYQDSGTTNRHGQPQKMSVLPFRYNVDSKRIVEVKAGSPDLSFEIASR
jgi:hypothetical protein